MYDIKLRYIYLKSEINNAQNGIKNLKILMLYFLVINRVYSIVYITD